MCVCGPLESKIESENSFPFTRPATIYQTANCERNENVRKNNFLFFILPLYSPSHVSCRKLIFPLTPSIEPLETLLCLLKS